MSDIKTSEVGRGISAAELDDDTLSAVRMMMDFVADEPEVAPEPQAEKILQALEPPARELHRRAERPAHAATPEPRATAGGADILPVLEADNGAARPEGSFLAKLAVSLPKPSLPKLPLPARMPFARKRQVDWLESDRSWDDLPYAAQNPATHGAADTASPETVNEPREKWQPTRKQIAAVLLIAVVIWKPWLIPGLLFLAFWVSLIIYFSLGPDRVTELVLGGWEILEKRRPERAASLLVRIQAGADKVDGWLARLPERWTDGIYLPDFGRSHVGTEVKEVVPDPFDRLASERHGDVGHPRRA